MSAPLRFEDEPDDFQLAVEARTMNVLTDAGIPRRRASIVWESLVRPSMSQAAAYVVIAQAPDSGDGPAFNVLPGRDFSFDAENAPVLCMVLNLAQLKRHVRKALEA